MANYFPTNHRHAERESRIISGLQLTWSAIADDCDSMSDRDCAGMLMDCYPEMYSKMSPEDLAAWHELCCAGRGTIDNRIATKMARAIIS